MTERVKGFFTSAPMGDAFAPHKLRGSQEQKNIKPKRNLMTYKLKCMLALLLLCILSAGHAPAATITWTNTSSGNWSVAANWSPNQVPGSSDNAVITTNGSYTVTLDISPTVGSLTLGGTSGTQTVATVGYTLTLNNASVVNTNGVLAMNGGNLSGAGPFTINGQLNCTNTVTILPGSALTIGTNGTLMLAAGNGGGYLGVGGVLTNAGTIKLVSGALTLEAFGGGLGRLINLPGALLDIQANDPGGAVIDKFSGTELIVNGGTVRKSAGTGTSTINPILNNTGSGLVEVQTGTINISGGDTINSTGVFQADAGATLQFNSSYTAYSGVQFNGLGTNVITGGTFTFNGLVTISNLLAAGGGLAGTNGVIAGTLTCANTTQFIPSSSLTIATNGTLILGTGNGGYSTLGGVLTNAGTIKLVSGALTLVAFGGGLGRLINLPGALLDIQANDPGGAVIDKFSGTELIVNEGTVRKSAGTGTSTINVILNNTNTLDAQIGTVSVNGGGSGTGVFQADTGATLQFNGSYTANNGAQFIGAGTNLLASGTFTLNGTIISSNAVLAGATLAGTNGVITGVMNWANAGFIAGGSTLTVGTNGVLVLAAGGGYGYLRGVLTNAGTIKLVSGILLMQAGGGGLGQLINLPGALVDIQTNDPGSAMIDKNNGTELIVNEGTVRKSVGTGTSTINTIFNNSGTLDVQSGIVSLSGSYNLTNGTLNFGISSLASFGKINLSGSPAKLAGMLSANLNNGYVPATGNSFAVLTYGSYTGMFTNTHLPAVAVWQTNYGPTSLTISVVSINMLAFTVEPAGGKLTNAILAPVVVQVENPGGNPIATNGVPVTVSLNSGSGTLSGTLTQNTDPTGKATFSDLSINLIGTKTLRASSSGLATATSTEFAIVPLIGTQWTNSGFVLQLNGTNSLGSTIIYASTNLKSWTPIYTNGPTNGAIIFLDPASTRFPYRFYRIRQE